MKNLLQLLAENRRKFTPIESRILAKGNAAAIYLYDPIVADRTTAEWWGGICPQDFVPAVRALETEEITIYTNCPGGDVFAAEAMCQALREHSAKVTMQIEGYAASAATAIACACDVVNMTAASKYMIHKTWTFAMGNDVDLLATVELLRKCDQSMYEEYVRRSGNTIEQVSEWCAAETWFTADEAVKNGFADSIIEAPAANARASAKWNLSAYANAPRQSEPPEQPEETSITDDHRARQQQRIGMLSRLQIS
ncbi:Clp protease ClpP [Massilia sp. RP-1-19]|uniref:Clp protease ClpP n=1 Tax=Massilia polaris TaxID=2728846 RepID=A0A848HNT2_9BURK|nr:head maturation protease, ClpP-related [Massilia polaris]NML61820.1 Clp protease ClpP [Massilia polaris]